MQHFFEFIEIGVEILGVGIIFLGIILAMCRAIWIWQWGHREDIYERLRQDIGRAILLGLEILIAADIIKTVTTELTLNNIINLGLIVLIRTILSISLEVEIEGKFPWNRVSIKKKTT